MTVQTVENKGVKQEFEVFGTITLPISIKVLAETHEEAFMNGTLEMNEETIQQAFLTFLLHNGSIVTPKVHDINVEIEAVYGEDE